MLLLSWNVAGRVGPRQRNQFRALNGRDWDVLCLQEVTPTSVAGWREFLEGAGLHVAISRVHDWREQGLSDHSAIWAELRPVPL